MKRNIKFKINIQIKIYILILLLINKFQSPNPIVFKLKK